MANFQFMFRMFRIFHAPVHNMPTHARFILFHFISFHFIYLGLRVEMDVPDARPTGTNTSDSIPLTAMPHMHTQTELTVHFNIDPILEQLMTYQIQQFENMMTELTSEINPPGMDPLFYAGNDGQQPWLSFYKYGLNCGEWRWHKLYYDHTGGLDWRITIIVPPQVLSEFNRRLVY